MDHQGEEDDNRQAGGHDGLSPGGVTAGIRERGRPKRKSVRQRVHNEAKRQRICALPRLDSFRSKSHSVMRLARRLPLIEALCPLQLPEFDVELDGGGRVCGFDVL